MTAWFASTVLLCFFRPHMIIYRACAIREQSSRALTEVNGSSPQPVCLRFGFYYNPPAESTLPRVITRRKATQYTDCRGMDLSAWKISSSDCCPLSALWASTHACTQTHTIYTAVCLWVGGRWRKLAVTALLRGADKSSEWTPCEGEEKHLKCIHTHTSRHTHTHTQPPVTAQAERGWTWRPLTKCPVWLCLSVHINGWGKRKKKQKKPGVSSFIVLPASGCASLLSAVHHCFISYVRSSKRELVERQKQSKRILVFTVFSVFWSVKHFLTLYL